MSSGSHFTWPCRRQGCSLFLLSAASFQHWTSSGLPGKKFVPLNFQVTLLPWTSGMAVESEGSLMWSFFYFIFLNSQSSWGKLPKSRSYSKSWPLVLSGQSYWFLQGKCHYCVLMSLSLANHWWHCQDLTSGFRFSFSVRIQDLVLSVMIQLKDSLQLYDSVSISGLIIMCQQHIYESWW